jgi:hypothetical protein
MSKRQSFAAPLRAMFQHPTPPAPPQSFAFDTAFSYHTPAPIIAALAPHPFSEAFMSIRH